jgi:hypothetical protein
MHYQWHHHQKGEQQTAKHRLERTYPYCPKSLPSAASIDSAQQEIIIQNTDCSAVSLLCNRLSSDRFCCLVSYFKPCSKDCWVKPNLSGYY